MIDETLYQLKHTFKFYDYPMHVQVSKSRRPVYYKKGSVLPKKYEDNIGLIYDWHNGVLYNIRSAEPVIKNIKTAGTPRLKKINGQDLHNLSMTDYDRSSIVTELKNYFFNNLQKSDKVEIDENKPIVIHMVFVADSSAIGDIDNHALFYQKSFFDSIQTTKLVKDKKTKKVNKVINPVGFIKDDNKAGISDFTVSFRQIPKTFSSNNALYVRIYQRYDEPIVMPTQLAIKKAIELTKIHHPDEESEAFKEMYDHYFNILTN